MSTINIIIVICAIAFGGYTYVQKQKHRDQGPTAVEAAAGDSTFVSLPPADGHQPGTVVVIAPIGCSREEARRAEQLAADLGRNGVRVQQTNRISFTGFDPAEEGRIQSVMNGGVPIVFVNGKGKANPTFNEVMAEVGRR